MAIPAISLSLLQPLRAAGFISFAPSAAALGSPPVAVANALQTSLVTGAPVPQGLGRSGIVPDVRSLLDRAYFRDLVAALDGVRSPGSVTAAATPVSASLGADSLLGRAGLPSALEQLSLSEGVSLLGSALSLFGTLQAMADDSSETADPSIGALLDTFA
jgi:hypothetical protein